MLSFSYAAIPISLILHTLSLPLLVLAGGGGGTRFKQVPNGFEYSGYNLGYYPDSDPAHCADHCMSTTGCVGFVVETKTGKEGCWLKLSFTNPKPSSNSNPTYIKEGYTLPPTRKCPDA